MQRQSGQMTDLPTLKAGITVLDSDESLGVEPLQSLVIDELIGSNGTALWVDACGRARTTTLRELAPHRRYLDRITVARGHTAYQHASLIGRATTQVDDATAILVAPCVDGMYRADDIPEREAAQLLARRLASLAGVARQHDLPVLTTTLGSGDLADIVDTAAHHTISCRDTPCGPRFGGEDHETLVYPEENGWVQTTLAFWREVLEHRAHVSDTATTPTHESPVHAGGMQ